MTGSEVALDTNRAIAVLNGEPKAVAWLRSYRRICLPVTVLAELRFGALNSGRVAFNQQRVDDMVSRSHVLDVTATTASVYAEVRVALKKLGRPIPQNDMWIAATCVDRGVPLATDDSHFSGVPGLVTVP